MYRCQGRYCVLTSRSLAIWRLLRFAVYLFSWALLACGLPGKGWRQRVTGPVCMKYACRNITIILACRSDCIIMACHALILPRQGNGPTVSKSFVIRVVKRRSPRLMAEFELGHGSKP